MEDEVERSVNQGRFLVTTPVDIRSENANMSNEKSVKNTIPCSQSKQSESVPKEPSKGLPSDG